MCVCVIVCMYVCVKVVNGSVWAVVDRGVDTEGWIDRGRLFDVDKKIGTGREVGRYRENFVGSESLKSAQCVCVCVCENECM